MYRKEKDRSLRSTDSKSLLLGKEAASRQHRNFNRPARSVRLGNAGQPPGREARDNSSSTGKPPATLRGTMKNASTGQMRSSNRPPACGAVAPGCADSHPPPDVSQPAGRLLWFSSNACAKRRSRRRVSVSAKDGSRDNRPAIWPHGLRGNAEDRRRWGCDGHMGNMRLARCEHLGIPW